MTTNDIDAIRKLAAAATDGPWVYNSYSAVLSGPKVQPHDEWLDTTGEHSLERHGRCVACGPDRRGCLLFSEDYKRDPIVAHVPAHHGDTAVGERAADAEFIAAARTLVPALCDEIEQLRAEREHTELHPTGTVEWLRNRVNELTAERDNLSGSFTGGAVYDFTVKEDLDLASLEAYAAETWPSTGDWVKMWLGDNFA